ncbi:hypothetical protein CsatA_001631 [Cannabis sativa]
MATNKRVPNMDCLVGVFVQLICDHRYIAVLTLMTDIHLRIVKIVDSIISHGSFLTNSVIEHSVVGIRSWINSNVHLKDTVMLGADFYETESEVASLFAEGGVPIGIGENTKIKECIIDKNARIGKNVIIANSEGVQEASNNPISW